MVSKKKTICKEEQEVLDMEKLDFELELDEERQRAIEGGVPEEPKVPEPVKIEEEPPAAKKRPPKHPKYVPHW